MTSLTYRDKHESQAELPKLNVGVNVEMAVLVIYDFENSIRKIRVSQK